MYQDCTLIIRVIQYLIQKNVEVLSRSSLSYGTINSTCTLFTIFKKRYSLSGCHIGLMIA